jgi:glycerol-3-phosphate acyltransferase PlsX
MKEKIKELKHKFDSSEHGGAPLLGISKPVLKAHGSSDEVSICACIKQARDYCESGIIEKFTNAINQQQ